MIGAIRTAKPRRSAPEGGCRPRTLRTRPPSRRKLLARSAHGAPDAAAHPGPVAAGAGHPAAGDRDPDGPRKTIPAWLRTAVSSALATDPVRSLPPPLLPTLRKNAVTPDGPRSEPAGTCGFFPSPTQPETILQTLPRTCSALKSQVPTRTGSRRRQRSSGGFSQAAATERSVNRSVPLTVRDPRHRRAAPSPLPFRGPAARHGPQRP